MQAADTVASTLDPAFAVDSEGSILAWNAAAEELLGHREVEVLTRRCWRVLSGRDVFGNDYCGGGCPLIRMARENRPVSRCELCFRGASGSFTHVGVSTMTVPDEQAPGVALVHLLTPVAMDSGCEEPLPWQLFATSKSSGLTARESQVLALLSDGQGTTEIAERLFICPATVRNHVKHVLAKLNVHSRLEAVSLARRVGLLQALRKDG